MKEMQWEGPVGCSITKAVARELGVDPDEVSSFSELDLQVGALLKGLLPRNKVVTMIHTEAAGYAHLSFAESQAYEDDGGDLVLVCTLGRALGGVLYNGGHRVRNTGMNSGIASNYEADLAALIEEFGDSWRSSDTDESAGLFLPDIPGDGEEPNPAWEAWVDLVDRYLIEMANYLKPDKIVIIPTGAAARESVVEKILPSLTVGEACESRPKVRGERKAAGTIVKGAAVGALVELKQQQAADAIQKAFGEDPVSLQTLSSRDLRLAFDAFDTNGNGVMSRTELTEGLKTMGLAQSTERIAMLARKLDPEDKGSITFDEFTEWWKRTITAAPVAFITSEEEWDKIVGNPFPHRKDLNSPLVVLEVGFTFCRPCKAFEGKYERFAQKYSDMRFVRVNGNENSSTVRLARDRLKVKKTPSFYLFRDEEMLYSWTGANPETFESAICKYSGDSEAGEGSAGDDSVQ